MVCKSLAVAIPKVTLRNREVKIDFLDYRYGGVVGVADIALVLCHGQPASINPARRLSLTAAKAKVERQTEMRKHVNP